MGAETAFGYVQGAIIDDLNGAPDLATANYRRCLQAYDFQRLPMRIRREIRRLLAFRDEATYSDYFDELVCSQSCAVWPQNKLPLKVFIPRESDTPEGFCPSLHSELVQCLDQWMLATHKRLSYKLVASSQLSDISFHQDNSLGLTSSSGQGGHTGFSSVGKPVFQVFTPAKTDVALMPPFVPLKQLNGANLAHMHCIYLHEIGHALGIRGHSCRAGDVMYFEHDLQAFLFNPGNHLSDRDIATINHIYSKQVSQDAESTLREHVANDNLFAACALGNALAADGPKKDYAAAIKMYRKAADEGMLEGKFFVALCYELGHGVKQDYKQSAQLYTEVAGVDCLKPNSVWLLPTRMPRECLKAIPNRRSGSGSQLTRNSLNPKSNWGDYTLRVVGSSRISNKAFDSLRKWAVSIVRSVQRNSVWLIIIPHAERSGRGSLRKPLCFGTVG